MKTFLSLALLSFLVAGCGKREEPPTPKAPPTSSGNPLTAPTDYLSAVAKAKKSAEKTIDDAALNQTIQLFFAQEGRFPKDLNELVAQQYLSALPKPPYQMKFDYNAKTGELKIVPQ